MAKYSAIVEDHFAHPRNAGAMSDATAVGMASNPVCGDTLKLFVRMEGGRVAHASFQAQGCPAAIAAGSMTTLLVIGRDRAGLEQLTNEEVARALGGLPPDKIHCSVLAEDALAEVAAALAL
ncbi:MAG: iron-sulfur cluster assembly scaffold protein [Candidatus Xenobia bacterium]